MPMNKYARAAIDAANDPGLGFALVCTLLFLNTNPVGLAGCVVASTLIAGVKMLENLDPPFMKKFPKLEAIVKDARTPLRVLALAMLMVMGTTLSMNAVDIWAKSNSLTSFIANGWLPAILPAITSTIFAVCDFKYAAAIGETMKTAKEGAEKSRNLIKTALKRPEFWGATGMSMMILMSGGTALISLPLVAGAFAISMRNLLQNRPAHEGHPNLYFAGSVVVTSVIAAVTAQPLLCAAYLIDAYYLGRLEVLTTPGGLPRVWQDIKTRTQTLVHKITGKNKQDMQADVQVMPETMGASLRQESLAPNFAATAEPQVQNTTANKASAPVATPSN